ncbi:UDP-glycosyltransferase 71K2 [Dichanthelium oligosanthes]|uniref:Glycosyltransferase n=1 Tax=Dichanthelium oligosanthes TaxID=888268 RepID=A0A1E5US16_9POAL|nr:UDP-glycosyltransferase 71K2 [Dichanthelium oligosanthes]
MDDGMPRPTVVLLPMWAPGHFSSMLQAGKRMLLCGAGSSTPAVTLTVLVIPPPMDSWQCEMASGDGIDFHHLPAVEHRADLPGHPSEYIQLYAPHVKEAIAGLAAPVAAVVVDFFGTPLLDVAHDLAVPAYVYFASTGAALALMLRLPAIYEEVYSTRLREKQGVVDVPGMPPVPVASMPSPELNDYAWFVYYGRRFMEARGIVVNTAVELEPGVLAAIADGRCTPGDRAPPVYPIGPVLTLKPRADGQSPHECVRWLDGRPPASVVFICFGSRGWMRTGQVREVAAGLERSGQSFLWVLRGPPAGSSLYPTDANLGDLLPDGFLERTKGKGFVWPSWAPQTEILAHAAVGAFVTHCGWNSILESLWHGVPMAPWPLYAEQPLNAFELVACMGVSVELRVCTGRDNFVEAAELERAVRSLMGGSEEGRRAREKATKMKAACRNAVEKGGTSYAATQRVVQDMLESYVIK